MPVIVMLCRIYKLIIRVNYFINTKVYNTFGMLYFLITTSSHTDTGLITITNIPPRFLK